MSNRLEEADTATICRQWDTTLTFVMNGGEPREILLEYADYLAAELEARGVSAVEAMGLFNDEDPAP